MKVLFSPHADDETLFAFFTILRHQPAVVICFPSERDYGDTDVRTEESRAAMRLAGVEAVEQWDGLHLVEKMQAFDAEHNPSEVWAPANHTSHPHHEAVTAAARHVFGGRLRYFHTYFEGNKVRLDEVVRTEPGWADLKRQALACYVTQRTHPRANVFYDEARFELDEYAPAAFDLDAPVGDGTPIAVGDVAGAAPVGDTPAAAPAGGASKKSRKKAGGK